jgi:hypothetical protein
MSRASPGVQRGEEACPCLLIEVVFSRMAGGHHDRADVNTAKSILAGRQRLCPVRDRVGDSWKREPSKRPRLRVGIPGINATEETDWEAT